METSVKERVESARRKFGAVDLVPAAVCLLVRVEPSCAASDIVRCDPLIRDALDLGSEVDQTLRACPQRLAENPM
jgi:hypothetical protein